MLRVTTLPAVAIAPSPNSTPGQTVTRAPIQLPSRRVTGFTTRSKAGSERSWFPVQMYAAWEIHTSFPIDTSARLSIQHSSPIQELSPMESRQGYLTRVPGLMTTFLPTFAPNARSRTRLIAEEGNSEHRNAGSPRKNQVVWRKTPRPGRY